MTSINSTNNKHRLYNEIKLKYRNAETSLMLNNKSKVLIILNNLKIANNL